MKQKIACLMSGGVDSSVACAILKDEGFDVTGFTLKLWSDGSRCCNAKDIKDAKRVALKLKVPHYVIDLRTEFKKRVIDYFTSEYVSGKTPNPCVICNEKIKFGVFLKEINNLGIKYAATGHYAKVSKNRGRYLLKKGKEDLKDQTYFLASLTQNGLSRIIFPLADFKKLEIRRKASKLGLSIADKKESQEICFIPDNDISKFIKKLKRVEKGEIVDCAGKVLGYHSGIINYTIGQRRGIRIPMANPLYVTKIDGNKNRIIVGDVDDLYSKEMVVTGLNWISVKSPGAPLKVSVKIRYNQVPSPAKILPLDKDNVVIRFDVPHRAVTPGQLAVFYKGDTVVGSGWIKS